MCLYACREGKESYPQIIWNTHAISDKQKESTSTHIHTMAESNEKNFLQENSYEEGKENKWNLS